MPPSGGLDRDVPIPLYYQLVQQLKADIEQGDWEPGDRFATEAELEQRFRVSRATVRHALSELTRAGYLVRVTGKGTFLARPRLDVQLPHLLSFSEEILARGMRPGTRVISAVAVPPPAQVVRELSLNDLSSNEDAGKPAADVLCVTRVRYADGEPLVYMVDYLHPRLGLKPGDGFEGSLYTILEERCGVRVDEAVHHITATLIPDEIARELRVAPGTPALRFARTSYDEIKRPVIYEEALCRGDEYRYSVRLKRKGGLRPAPP